MSNYTVPAYGTDINKYILDELEIVLKVGLVSGAVV